MQPRLAAATLDSRRARRSRRRGGREDRTTRVCVITTVHTPHDGRILFKECASLAKRYEVTLLAFADMEPEQRGRVSVKPLPKPKGRPARVMAGSRMLRAAVAERADIYHFHDPEFLFQARKLKRITGKPVIYDVHENYPVTFDHKDYLPGLGRRIGARAVDSLERRVTPHLDAVVVADDDLVRRFNPFAPRVVAVKNYPPADALPPPDFDYPRKPWAIHVGGLALVRGADKLLEAFVLVHRALPEARLVLVGDVRLDENQLEGFLERYGIADVVDVNGFLPYPEAMDLVTRCRVGVAPMPHHEKFRRNLASKVFDYMGAGTPYVASDWGAIAETVKGVGGRLVDTESAEAMAQTMLAFLANDELARQTGREGRQAMEDEFNWGTQEKKLFELYDKLLAEGDSKG